MKTKRTSTGYKGIYLNERTGKYDVKYNYTVVQGGTKKYCSKWKCGIATMAEAKLTLLEMHVSAKTPEDTVEKPVPRTDDPSVTLKKACELWESKAVAQNLSPVTIRNTRDQFKMITRVLPPETLIADIDEEMYYDFAVRTRLLGYSEETIKLINGTLRKLINLCYKRRLIPENILTYCDNIRVRKKEDYRVISKEEYDLIDSYFADSSHFRKHSAYYRFLFAILYFTGIRIGEALALTYDDFKPFRYSVENEKAEGLRVSITKSYVPSLKITKVPKNFKTRQIPVVSHPAELFEELRSKYLTDNDDLSERICPVTYTPIDNALKLACRELGLPAYHLHEFRHSFISYLISQNIPITVIEKLSGDTQNTILTRYSHCFHNAETMVISVLENL